MKTPISEPANPLILQFLRALIILQNLHFLANLAPLLWLFPLASNIRTETSSTSPTAYFFAHT